MNGRKVAIGVPFGAVPIVIVKYYCHLLIQRSFSAIVKDGEVEHGYDR
jgi:hypothetical protein